MVNDQQTAVTELVMLPPSEKLQSPTPPKKLSVEESVPTSSPPKLGNHGTTNSSPSKLTRQGSKHMSLNSRSRLQESDMTCKLKVWLLMEEPSLDPVAEKIHNVYSCMILLSVLTMVLGTLKKLKNSAALEALEILFNVLFSVEASVRIVCSPQRKALLTNSYMWMDILAVLPFYVFLFLEDSIKEENIYLELIVLLVPILRLLKVTRHSSGWRLLVISMKLCLEPLMVPAFLLLLMIVFSSCLIFWSDKHFAPEGDGPAFRSIPHTMWFTIVTVSTVGFGDVSPHSDLGMAASSGLILVGVCYMAMPLAIVGGTFGMVWQERDRILISEKSKAKFSEGGFSKEQLAELFEAIDQDGSGALSKKEFVQLIQAFNLGFTTAQIKKLYRSIDEDGTGTVNFQEFCDFLFPEIEIDDDEEEKKEDDAPPSKVEPQPFSDDGPGPDQPVIDGGQQGTGAYCAVSPRPFSPSGTSPTSHDRSSPTATKDKSNAFRKIQNGANMNKFLATSSSPEALANDGEIEAEVRNLENDVKSMQQEMRDGFQAINALLGIPAASLASQWDRHLDLETIQA